MKDTVCGMIRPAYEVDQFVAALLISLLYLTLARLLPCLQVPSLAISGLFGMYAIFKVTAVARQIRFVLCFIGADRPIVKTDKDLLSITNDKSRGDALQLGYGFAWQPQHLRNARDILDMNIAEYRTQALCRYELWKILKTQPLVFLFHPWSTFRQINGQKDLIAIKRGATWIQTLEYCKPRFLPRSELTPHTLITGSSGAGKTSALRWICAQEIARKRIVIIVDPKGDKGLYTCSKLFTKKCCREFHEFNAAHPERSEALNLLSNFKEVSELASRISQVLPSSGESAVFNEMGRNALAAVAVGMAILGENPTIETLFKNYVNRQDFGERVLSSWLQSRGIPKENLPLSGKTAQERIKSLSDLCLVHSSTPEIVGIISFLRTTDEMLDKTTTSIRNVLDELARGKIGHLLSPSVPSQQTVLDARMLLERRCVFYLGSDSLTYPSLGRLLCALFLADLSACAGDIYNFGRDGEIPEITLIIDEASEVACGPLQDLLSKGRGAGFSIIVATQSISDFIARLGSEAETARIVANTMNHIVMRNSDRATLEHVTESVPHVSLPQKSWSRAEASDGQSLIAQSSQTAERLTKQPEQPIIAKELISALPPGEAFAILAGNYVEKIATPLMKLEEEE